MKETSVTTVNLGHYAVELATLAQKEGMREDAERMIELAYQIFDQANLTMPKKRRSSPLVKKAKHSETTR